MKKYQLNGLMIQKKKQNSKFTFKKLVDKYNISFKELTDNEVEEDLIRLSSIVKEVFNSETQLYIIPNIDLKLQTTKEYIPKRHNFVTSLNKICDKHKFHF